MSIVPPAGYQVDLWYPDPPKMLPERLKLLKHIEMTLFLNPELRHLSVFETPEVRFTPEPETIKTIRREGPAAAKRRRRQLENAKRRA